METRGGGAAWTHWERSIKKKWEGDRKRAIKCLHKEMHKLALTDPGKMGNDTTDWHRASVNHTEDDKHQCYIRVVIEIRRPGPWPLHLHIILLLFFFNHFLIDSSSRNNFVSQPLGDKRIVHRPPVQRGHLARQQILALTPLGGVRNPKYGNQWTSLQIYSKGSGHSAKVAGPKTRPEKNVTKVAGRAVAFDLRIQVFFRESWLRQTDHVLNLQMGEV